MKQKATAEGNCDRFKQVSIAQANGIRMYVVEAGINIQKPETSWEQVLPVVGITSYIHSEFSHEDETADEDITEDGLLAKGWSFEGQHLEHQLLIIEPESGRVLTVSEWRSELSDDDITIFRVIVCYWPYDEKQDRDNAEIITTRGMLKAQVKELRNGFLSRCGVPDKASA